MTVKQYYNWMHYMNDMEKLKRRLNPDDYDVVVGIARGGLIPATELSHYLGKPLVPLVWQTRDGIPPEEFPGEVAKVIFQKRILLVDDICDSGETLFQVYDALFGEYNQLVNSAVTLCLHYNRAEKMFTPDIWAVEIDKEKNPVWLVYPWEKQSD